MTREEPEKYQQTINKAKHAPVLLWDDLFKGRDNPTNWVIEVAMEIIDYRYLNRMPMIVSSERNIKQLVAIDEALGSRVYQMTKDHLIEFEGDGLNFRLTEV
jgi:DNA replication protein DnaC